MKNGMGILSVFVVIAIAGGACARKESAAGPQEGTTSDRPVTAAAAAPETSTAEEKTYELRGRIVSRDATKGTVTVEHEKIEGLWEPMTMGFEVQGDVTTLPPDGSRIRATLHTREGRYWLTEIRPE